MTVFKPVERGKRNYELVIEQLQQLIAGGQIKPGDRIPPERELSDMLRVSRTSIREALKILEALDLVFVRAGEGTFLKKPSISGIITPIAMFLQEESDTHENLFETRTLLESGIARLAALRRTEQELEIIEQACHQIKNSTVLEEVIAADIHFHSSVILASKNPTLFSFASLISELIKHGVRKTREVLFIEPGANEISAAQHFDIYDAIRDQDPDRAYRAMYTHLEYTASSTAAVQNRRQRSEDQA